MLIKYEMFSYCESLHCYHKESATTNTTDTTDTTTTTLWIQCVEGNEFTENRNSVILISVGLFISS